MRKKRYTLYGVEGKPRRRGTRIALWSVAALLLIIVCVAAGSYLWFRAEVSSANNRVTPEIRAALQQKPESTLTTAAPKGNGAAGAKTLPPVKSFRTAVVQIVLADISMSLDNVLAVAGVARDHPYILMFGLALSVAMMAVASTLVARLLKRYHWIAYIGLAIIAYVALHMIWDGSMAVLDAADVSILP